MENSIVYQWFLWSTIDKYFPFELFNVLFWGRWIFLYFDFVTIFCLEMELSLYIKNKNKEEMKLNYFLWEKWNWMLFNAYE